MSALPLDEQEQKKWRTESGSAHADPKTVCVQDHPGWLAPWAVDRVWATLDAARERIAALERERDEAQRRVRSIMDNPNAGGDSLAAAVWRSGYQRGLDDRGTDNRRLIERNEELVKQVARQEKALHAADEMRDRLWPREYELVGEKSVRAYDAARAETRTP